MLDFSSTKSSQISQTAIDPAAARTIAEAIQSLKNSPEQVEEISQGLAATFSRRSGQSSDGQQSQTALTDAKTINNVLHQAREETIGGSQAGVTELNDWQRRKLAEEMIRKLSELLPQQNITQSLEDPCDLTQAKPFQKKETAHAATGVQIAIEPELLATSTAIPTGAQQEQKSTLDPAKAALIQQGLRELFGDLGADQNAATSVDSPSPMQNRTATTPTNIIQWCQDHQGLAREIGQQPQWKRKAEAA